MQRKIKYKAKTIDKNNWIYGYYVNKNGKHYIFTERSFYDITFNIGEGEIKDNIEQEFIEINPETLCQFTGLYDYYNTEIYENDIIELPYIDLSGNIYLNVPDDKVIIKFNYGTFGFETNTKFIPIINLIEQKEGEYIPNNGNKIEYGKFIGKVVGNIYK